jgi:hypothetical protein
MKSSMINRDTGGGVKKSGTAPGIGGAMRVHKTTGLDGILLRQNVNEIVDLPTNKSTVFLNSCPVTQAQLFTLQTAVIHSTVSAGVSAGDSAGDGNTTTIY